MDVTMKAGLVVRQSHAREVYDEPKDDMEFGELFGQFNFGGTANLDINDMVVPNQELTVGMQDHEDVESYDLNVRQDKTRVVDESQSGGQQERDNDVETANQLLSKRSSKEADAEPDDVGLQLDESGKEQVDESVQHEVYHSKDMTAATQKDLSDLQQLSSDQHQGIVERRLLTGNQIKITNERVHRRSLAQQNGGLSNSNDTSMNPLLETMTQSGPREQKSAGNPLNQNTLQIDHVEPGVELDGIESALDGESTQVDQFNIGKVSRKPVSSSQSSTFNAQNAVDAASASLSMVSSQKANGSGAGADSVQISSKGRTIGNLVGIGQARAKQGPKTLLKEPVLDRMNRASEDVELPEDVDKLSVVRQVSDELKLRFGRNQTVEVNLNPAELGRVRIQLQMQSDQTVNVRVSAEHSMIADLLNMNLNDLRRDLLAQGVQVNEIEVDADAHGQGEYEGQDREQSSEDDNSNDESVYRTDDDGRRRVSVQA